MSQKKVILAPTGEPRGLLFVAARRQCHQQGGPDKGQGDIPSSGTGLQGQDAETGPRGSGAQGHGNRQEEQQEGGHQEPRPRQRSQV